MGLTSHESNSAIRRAISWFQFFFRGDIHFAVKALKKGPGQGGARFGRELHRVLE
jgi:hypothetical protein